MPRRPMATRGGFDSRPVADAAASGKQEVDSYEINHHGARGVLRFAQPDVAHRRNTETAPRNPHSEPGAIQPAPKAKEKPVNNLNSILLEGNLTRDPELRYTPKGTAVCTLEVSSVRTCKLDGERHEEVSLIEAVTAGKLATVCAEHLAKGRGVRVVGRIKQERVGGHRGQQPLEGRDRRRTR